MTFYVAFKEFFFVSFIFFFFLFFSPLWWGVGWVVHPHPPKLTDWTEGQSKFELLPFDHP